MDSKMDNNRPNGNGNSNFTGSRYNQGTMDNNANRQRPSSRSLESMMGTRHKTVNPQNMSLGGKRMNNERVSNRVDSINRSRENKDNKEVKLEDQRPSGLRNLAKRRGLGGGNRPPRTPRPPRPPKDIALKRKVRKVRAKRAGAVFGGICVLGLVGLMIYLAPIQKEMKKKVQEKVKEGFNTSKCIVYAGDNTEISDVFANSKKEQVNKADMNEEVWNNLCHSVIDVEDRDFYKHSGINYKSLAGAIFSGIKSGDFKGRGGSTITQQLVKLYVLNDTSKNLSRKIKEAFGALEMENQIEKLQKTNNDNISKKDRIMELYLNNINYSNNCIGMKSAAKLYFNKDIEELDLAHIAYLSTIPNNPTRYDPFGTEEEKENTTIVNPRTRERMQTIILKAMLTCNTISKEQFDKAVSEIPTIEGEILKAKATRKNAAAKGKEVSSYVRSYIKEATIDYLAKAMGNNRPYKSDYTDESDYEKALNDYKNVTDYIENKLSTNSQDIVIKTSIDLKKQEELQKQVDNVLDNKSKQTKFDKLISKSSGKLNKNEKKVVEYMRLKDGDTKTKKKESLEKSLPEFKGKLKTENMGEASKLDKYIQSVYEKTGVGLGDNISYDLQGSATCIKNDEGSAHVVAIVGGRKTTEGNIYENGINRATKLFRQAGSSFKPIVVYGPCFEQSVIDEKKI